MEEVIPSQQLIQAVTWQFHFSEQLNTIATVFADPSSDVIILFIDIFSFSTETSKLVTGYFQQIVKYDLKKSSVVRSVSTDHIARKIIMLERDN